MKTPRFSALAAALLAALLSWMAPAPASAAQMVAAGSGTVLAEGTPGYLSASLWFAVSGGTVSLASVNYQVTMGYGGPVVSTGTLSFPNHLMSREVPVFFSYSALPPNGATLVFVPTGATGIEVQNSYGFSMDYVNVKRRLTVSGGSAAEGHAGTTGLPFTITMNKVLADPLTFNFTGSGGTAVAGQDYDAAPGTATIPAGQTSVTVHLSIIGDTAAEENETAGLALSAFSQLAAVETQTPATILTDDYLPGPVPSPVTVTELAGTGTVQAWFAVDLPAARVNPFSCRVSTRDGTAAAGSDYRALPPVTITFAPGETRKWAAITITASPAVEAPEQFFLDVEALDSHEVKFAACTIEPLTTAFEHLAPDIYRVRFPAGHGQRYVVEESADLSPSGWTPNSGVFTGTGAVISHLMAGDAARKFFRVTILTPQPPGPAAASS